MADLLAGKGAGFAEAAELAHYPGPAHVLQMAQQLQLSADQERSVREVFSTMETDAKRFGRQYVDAETALDQAFRQGTVTPEQLAALAEQSAGFEAQLRAAHLAAHIKMKAILTPQQTATYDRLRGYDQAADPTMQHEHTMHQG